MGNRIVRVTFLLILGTIFSKILGFAREILFVHRFGATAVSDAFLLTQNIPNILFSALAVAINMNFIPISMEMPEKELRNRFSSNLLNVCLGLTSIGCVLINLFSRQLLWMFAPSLPDETVRYAIIMLRIVSFSIVPIIVQRLFQAYSQANGLFVSTALLGCVTNFVMIGTYMVATEASFWFLSVGVVLAQLAAMVMALGDARKAGFGYFFATDFGDSGLKAMLSLTIPLMVGKFAEDASLLVDQNLAAGIGTGVISALAYASLIARAIGSMIISSLTTAAFPVFSRLAAEGDRGAFASEFIQYLRLLCYSLFPISVFMVLFADDVVVCILQHGVLNASAAKMIWEGTSCYAAGLLPLGIQNYLVRGFYAFRETKIPTYIVLVSLFCNIGLSILSAPYFGHIGITSATSISYCIAAVLLMYCFSCKYAMNVFQALTSELLSCFAMAAPPAALSYWLFHVVGFADSILVKVFFEGGLFFSFYTTLFFVTHKQLFHQLVALIGKRI